MTVHSEVLTRVGLERAPGETLPIGRAGRAWIDAAAIALFVLLVRSPGFPASSLDWDESCYVLMAREILAGHLPYVTMFLEKPLGAPVLVAMAMGLFGQNLLVVRLLGFASVLATCLILRAIMRSANQPRGAATAAALLYAAFSTQSGGLATNIELLVSPFTAGAVLVIIHYRDATALRARVWMVVASGLLFGLAIQLKYLPAIPAAVLFCLVAGRWLVQRTLGYRAALLLGGLFAVMCWLPVASGAAVYWWAGRLQEFMLCNFGFMSSYVEVKQPLPRLEHRIMLCLVTLLPLIVLSGVAVLRRRGIRSVLLIVMVWLGAEVAALVAPWKFWDHYFLLLLPPLCLLAALSLDEFARALAAPRAVSSRGQIAGPVLAIAVAFGPVINIGSWLIRGELNIRQPDAPRAVADIIRSDPRPNATAWIVNYEPVVYFLANIPIPTRYPFPPHLVGPYSGYNGSQPRVEVGRILSSKPRYMIVSNDWQQVQPMLRPLIQSAIDSDYRLFQIVGADGEVRIYQRREPEMSASIAGP